jgi:hypothetical protein
MSDGHGSIARAICSERMNREIERRRQERFCPRRNHLAKTSAACQGLTQGMMKAAEMFNEYYALSRLARVARRLSGASARAGPRLALHGIAVASGTLTRLRICGGFRAHWPPRAQAARVEAAFEII